MRQYGRKGRYVLLYLLKRFNEVWGDKLYGRKKLQKLLFLIEHLDVSSEKLSTSTGLTGYKFIIWLYGPFSPDIYKDVEDLVLEGYIKEEVIGSDSEIEVNNIRLTLYDDDGSSKVMYIYRPSWKLRYKLLLRHEDVLNKEERKKIDHIIKKYGGMSASELEQKVLELLNLTPEKKKKYMGKSVDEYLREEGLT